MISQQGKVVAVEGNQLLVEIGARSGCKACDAGKGCGAGVFGRLLRNRPVTVPVPLDDRVAPGDPVDVGIAEQAYLYLVLRLYLAPLLAGLLGAALGFALGHGLEIQGGWSDLLSLLAGLLSAGLVVLWNRRGLREFPTQTTVHFVGAVRPSEQMRCGGSAKSRVGHEQPQQENLIHRRDKSVS